MGRCEEAGVALFRDRQDAGEKLAWELAGYRGPLTVVVGLPRGGVPVAAEVARALEAPLDVLLVRKLGHPAQPELAVGALAQGGFLVWNEDVLRSAGLARVQLGEVVERERRELARRAAAYRGDRPPLDLAGKTVLIVDDGLATGATMRAAVAAARGLGAASVVVAVPVAAPDTLAQLTAEADEVVCVAEPQGFQSVGQWYARFGQTTDDEVRALLAAGRQP